nr:transcriptional regulatory protein AlgP-like [Misgurnus anguillicaudatus]
MSSQTNPAQEIHHTTQDYLGPSDSGRDVSIKPEASPQAGRSSRIATRIPRRKGPSSRTPQRRSPPSPSYASASPGIPDIKKWSILGLELALENADIPFSRKQTKAQLFSLLRDSRRATQPPQTAVTASSDSSSLQARKTRRSQRHHMKPSASLGRPPMSPAASSQASQLASQPDSANMLPLTATASLLPLPLLSPGQWPAAPPSLYHTGLRSAAAPAASIFPSHISPIFSAGADTSAATASLLPLLLPPPGQWPAAPPSLYHTGLRSAAAPATSIFLSHISPTFSAGADTSSAKASLIPLPLPSPGQWPAAPPSLYHTGLRSAAAPATSIFPSHISPTLQQEPTRA